MTSPQVVKMSVTNNSSFENYPHPDNHTMQTNSNIIVNKFKGWLQSDTFGFVQYIIDPCEIDSQ